MRSYILVIGWTPCLFSGVAIAATRPFFQASGRRFECARSRTTPPTRSAGATSRHHTPFPAAGSISLRSAGTVLSAASGHSPRKTSAVPVVNPAAVGPMGQGHRPSPLCGGASATRASRGRERCDRCRGERPPIRAVGPSDRPNNVVSGAHNVNPSQLPTSSLCCIGASHCRAARPVILVGWLHQPVYDTSSPMSRWRTIHSSRSARR